MKRLALFTLCLSLIISFGNSRVEAQRLGGARAGQGGGAQGGPGGRGGQAGERRGGGERGGSERGGAMRSQPSGDHQTPPLMRIFDTDGNGELSSAEIGAAALVLNKMDRNSDGRLSAEEIGPSGQDGNRAQKGGRQSGGPGGRMGQQGGDGQQGPGAGRQGSGGQGSGGRGMSRGDSGAEQGGGGRRQGGQGRGGKSGQSDAAFADQVLAFDADKDGMLSQSELPEHMHKAFALADADRSGSLNEAERLVLASQFRRKNLQPGGEDLEMQNRPTQGRRPGSGN